MSENLALVTGGSRGIGKACALHLAQAGYNVVINYAGNEEAANKTVSELEALGVKAEAVKFDISNHDEAQEAVAKIIEKYGRIDVLVNNAGITRDGLFMRMSKENWDAVINTNLTGAFNVTQPVIKVMMKQRSGAIVNMASIVGIYGNAGQANYAAAKAGLIGFTKSLAKELGLSNIRVNSVAPGFIDTDINKNISEQARKEFIEQIPMGKIGQTEDISKCIEWLIEDNYTTGQVISINGGIVI